MIEQRLENLILEKYLKKAVMRIKGVSHQFKHYQFSCNICGDSKKNRSKKRGHLMLSDRYSRDPFWVYKCFNVGDCACAGEGNAWPARKWLEVSFPFLYNDFVREILSVSNKEDISKIEKENDKHEKTLEIQRQEIQRQKKRAEKKDLKFFKPILKLETELGEKARVFCKRRNIPEHIWTKFFVSTGGTTFKNRLIIPFYNSSGKIYYWQARSLYNEEPKYLNRNSSKDTAVYNIYNIDKTKPVIAVEGAIDAMFIENAIAICGLELSDQIKELMSSMDVYYLFDNDGPGINKSKQYLQEGKNVFLWKKFRYYDKYMEKQDINQVFLDNKLSELLTFEELKHCFSDCLYDSIFL